MRPTSPLPKRSSKKAAALIIVLAFVVILTGLAVAYLSVATTDRQLAHSSFHDTAADLLARSALDIVVGDFKQEIVNGSTPTPVSGSTIYIPKSLTPNIVPTRNGYPPIPGGVETNDPIPNLIRRSIRLNDLGQANAMPTPGVPSRGSAVNSTTDVSANGRSISLAKWNSHYLIPRANPSDTTGDSTPISGASGFTPPDWVIVTRAGPTPFPVWNSALKDPTATNTTYAIGRYAYAVYDEGGLLDINVAGYPTSTGASPTTTDIGRKGVLAFGDLTALPTTPGNYMSTAAVNKFILFRNYATMGSTGTLDSPITSDQASAFVNYYLGGTPPPTGTSKDFGIVNNVTTGSGSSLRTDQNFITRAELINFLKSAQIANVNTLQYLGTFSREQNKPNFQLTTTWQFGDPARRVLPQRFYLGNLKEVVNPPTDDAKIRQYFGLQFASADGEEACANQVRWKYVGQGTNTTPLPAIPPFPTDLTTLDFFQYINYALFGVTAADALQLHFPSTLQRGASIIDEYDYDSMITGIYFIPGSNPDNCDPSISACITFGAETGTPPPPLSCVRSPSPTPPPPIDVLPNRPLRSVGEFSYAYSLYDAIQRNNSPYYLTNYKDKYKKDTNPDPALLDFFTYNSAQVRSGIVSLNTRQPPVLAALLKGAIYNDATSAVVPLGGSTTGAIAAANSIVNATYKDTTTRALSRADIPNLAKTTVITTPPFTNDDVAGGTFEARETIARALSEVVQTRTWGLLIDLVAQTGHYKPNATGLADFIVEGEKRYWLHIAIDRFDGTVVGQQLEEVVE